MGGQRRRANGSERSMAILLGGALTGVLAVCAVAGLFILKGASSDDPNADTSPVARVMPTKAQQRAEASPSFTPFDVVPDACDLLPSEISKKLVPRSTQGVPPAVASDSESRCSWGDFGVNDPRELSVELRGSTSIDDSKRQFSEEWRTDSTGKGLIGGQKLKYSRQVTGLGEAAYALYIVDSDSGSAIVNARYGNVLITVRFAGRTGADKPLSKDQALNGATETADVVIAAVRKAGQG